MAPGYVPGTLGEEEEFTWRTRYNYALQTHLSYAGSLPLKMCAILPTRGFDLPVNAEYFQLLTKALPRLSYLNVFVHGKRALDHFSTLPQNFGKLKTLVFSVLFEDNSNQIRTQPDRPLTLFDHCPLLSEMDLTWMFGSNDTRIPLTDWAHMPSWSNLTRIKASNVHAVDIFRILKISTKLIDATFNISSRSGDDGQSSSEDEIVTCPVLRMLDMDLRRPQQPPSFTDRLQLPALTHLVVSLPRSTQFRLALPVRPPCLGSLTHLVFTHIGVLWDTQQWVDLLTSTPSVTHLKMAFFIGVGRLVSRLSDTTLLAGLRMLMIDGVTEDPEFYDPDSDASDEDARALGLHLSAFTTARFGPYPLPGSVSSNGMAGLKIIFADEEYASRMYASACYSWNGWSTGSPLNCPVYARLEDTLAHTVCTLGQLDGLERDSLDAVIIREVLLEEIPEIVDASKGCKGHHLTEPIDEEMGAVEILAWLRGCFPNENVCEDLWSSWQELKAEYMNGPGWVCAEIELETGWQVFRALEFVPSGAYRVRNSLRKQKMIQTYPDLKSDIWWSTDIPLGQFKD